MHRAKGKRYPKRLANAKAEEIIARRLQRIKCIRGERQRRNLLRSCVIPQISWCGAWNAWQSDKLKSIGTEIERTVTGTQIFPARALVWISRLGCELDPAYVADYNALRRERRHAHENAERPGRWRPMVGARWKEVCDKWEWRLTIEGEFRYITPFGEVDLQRDSHAAIERHTRMAWERALLRSEPRADDERSRELFADPAVEAVVSGHVKRAQRFMEKRYQMESVTASTVDGKDLQRIIARRTGGPAAETICSCGARRPNRSHWIWECPHARAHGLRRPNGSIETELFVPLAELPPEPAGRTWDVHPELVRKVVEAADGRLIVMGTDGGADSFGSARFRRAAWGVAVGDYATDGKCQGTDTSAFAGEAQALLQALRALDGAARTLEAVRGNPDLVERVVIVIDNMAVVNSTKAAVRTGGLPKNAAGI